jgi:hypothetical protein
VIPAVALETLNLCCDIDKVFAGFLLPSRQIPEYYLTRIVGHDRFHPHPANLLTDTWESVMLLCPVEPQAFDSQNEERNVNE